MRKELIGSFLIFGFLFVFSANSWRRRIALAMILALKKTLYQGFMVRLIHANWAKAGQVGRGPILCLPWAVMLPALGLFQGSFPLHMKPESFAHCVSCLCWNSIRRERVPNAQGVRRTPRGAEPGLLRAPPRTSLSGNIWKVSYAVDVNHFLALRAFTTSIVLGVVDRMGHASAFVVSTPASLAVIVALAALATRWIDDPVVALSNGIGRPVSDAIRTFLPRRQPYLTMGS
jgi:hypothetical protein